MADQKNIGELTDEQLDQVAGGIGAGEQGSTSPDDGTTTDAKKGTASPNLLAACSTGVHVKSATLVNR